MRPIKALDRFEETHMLRTTMLLALAAFVAAAAVTAQEAPPPVIAGQPTSAAATQPESQPAAPPAVAPPPATAPAPIGTVTSAPAGRRTLDPKERALVFQFEGVPYSHVIKKFAQSYGKTIWGGEVHIDGTLTFYDSVPYNYEEAFDLLNTLLQMRGFELREDGRFLKLVPISATFQNNKIFKGLDKAEDVRASEIVTVILPLKYIDSDSAVKSIVRMVSTFGSVAPMTRGRGLLITDRLASIKRIQSFLEQIDQDTMVDRQMRTYKLENASARSMAQIITDLLGRGGRTPTRGGAPGAPGAPAAAAAAGQDDSIAASADERTNTLTLIGPAEKLALAEELIHKLDVPRPLNADVRVFTLKQARAEEMARTLREAFVTSSGRQPAQPGQPNQPPTPTPAAASRVSIVADSATNRVIVTAPVDQMIAIEKLIAELDQATEKAAARIVRLQNADAQQLAPVVAAAVNKTVDTRSRQQQGAPLACTADPRSNSLLLAGNAGDIESACALITQLDVEIPKEGPSARVIKVWPLKAGDARQVASSLLRLFQQQSAARGGRGPGGAPAGADAATALRVEAETASNSLIISAAPGDWPLVQSILEEIAKNAEPVITPVTRLIPLKNAKAGDLATTLRQIYDRRASAGRTRGGEAGGSTTGVVITASENANALLITAAENDQELIGALVKQLDVPPSPDGVEGIHIVELKSANAEKVAATLRSMVGQASGPRGGGAAQQVYIQADPLTNTVLIRAPEAQRAMLQDVIAKLDKGNVEVVRETRTIHLKSIAASAVVPMLGQLYSPARAARQGPRGAAAPDAAEDVIITAAPGDKALVIDAPKRKIDEIAALVASFDTAEQQPWKTEVRTYELTGSTAAEVAAALTRLYSETPARGGGGARPAAATSAEPTPKFQADSGTNTLIAQATVAQFADIEKTIESLKAKGELINETKVYTIKAAKADDIAALLDSMLTGGQSGGGRGAARRDQPVRVSSMSAANAVVVQGPRDKQVLAAELIKSFDVEGGVVSRQIRTYTLANSDATEVARTLSRLFTEQQARGGRGAAAPSPADAGPRFEADANTNQLIVAATIAQFVDIDKIITELQKGIELASKTETFRLQFAKADDLAPIVEKMLTDTPSAQRPGRGGAASGKAAAVKVASVPGANSILVQAPADKVALAGELVKQFDKAESSTKTIIQIVALKSAEPVSLAQSVNQALAARPSAGGPRGGKGASAAAADDAVSVVAETNSNSVLVRGPADGVAEAVAMIQKLDSGPDTRVAVRVIPLKNSDASELLKPLTTMFGDLVRQQAAAKKTGEKPTFSATADARTNSLIVSTTPAMFTLVEQILAQIDRPSDVPQRDIRFVQLANADAYDVANKVDALYKDRRGPDKPVIDYDYTSNTITVVAKSTDLAEIEPMIKRLDATVSTQIRVVPMTQVRAERMAEMLQRVYGQTTDSQIIVVNKPGASATQPAVVPAGRSLFAPAPADDGSPTLATQPAAAAPAAPAAMAPAMEPAKEPVVITVDKASNSLIISANRQEMDRIQSLIDKFTSAPASSGADFRIFKVSEADVFSVARVLEDLFNPKPTLVMPEGGGAAAGGRAGTKGAAPAAPAAQPRLQAQPPVITVVPDTRTRSLIVRAKSVEFDVIEQVIAHLDQKSGASANEVRVFVLKNTDATEVANNVRELFNIASRSTTTPGRTGAAATPGAPGAPGAATRATPQDARVEMIRQFFEMRNQDGGVTQIDAASTLSVSANRQANSVVVAAPHDAMGLVVKIIEDLDQSGQISTPVVRMYPVKNAEVSAVVGALQDLFVRQTAAAAGGARAAAAGGRSAAATGRDLPVVVTGDEASKLVIVSAASDMQPLVESVINEIDNKRGGEEQTVVKVYRLDHSDATTAAAALTSTLAADATAGATGAAAGRGGRTVRPGVAAAGPRIAADRGSNTIIARATPAEHEKITALLAEIDKGAQQNVQVIVLKNADPEQVAANLARVFGGTVAQPAARGGGRGGAAAALAGERGSVVFAADRDSRMLMVRTDEETFAKVKQLAEQIDASSTAGASQTYIVRLSASSAPQVAAMVRDLYNQQRAAKGAAAVEPMAVTSDERSNTLLISGNRVCYDQVCTWVGEIEKIAAEKGKEDLRVIALENADPDQVAALLTRLFGQPLGPRGPAGTAGRTGPGAAPGAKGTPGTSGAPMCEANGRMLLIRADEETFKRIQEIAAQMDAAAKAGRPAPTIIPLKYVQAAAVAPSLQAAFVTTPARGAVVKPEDQVIIVAEPQSNALIVTAGAENLRKVQSLVTQVDTESAPGTAPVRIIPLKNADPTNVAGIITRLFNQQAASAAPAGPAGRGGVRPTVGVMAKGGLVIEPDRDAKLLLVRTDDETFKAVKELVEHIDSVSEGVEINPTIVPLKFAQAATVAASLQAAFAPAAGGASGRGAAAASPADRVVVVADVNSNSVIVAANAENTKRAADLIAKMDVESAGLAPVRIIALRNADPDTLAKTLRNLFPSAAAPSAPAGGAGRGAAAAAGGARATAGQTIIEADRDSRSLLVRADDETFAKIKAVVDSMDATSTGGAATPSIITLKHANAVSVAASLQQSLAPARGATLKPDDVVTVVAEPNANAVIVTANSVNLARVQSLIAQLDTDTGGVKTEFVILKNAKAVDVAAVLSKVVAGAAPGAAAGAKGGVAGPKVTISGDAGSNAVVMSGPAGELEKYAKMAADLDQASLAGVPSVYLIPLKNNNASVVAGMVRDLYNQQKAAAKGGAVDNLAVSADARSNAVVLATSKEMYEKVSEWVTKIEEMTPSRGALRIITLQNADPTELDKAIQQIYNGAQAPAGAAGTKGPAAPASGAPVRPGPTGAAGSGGAVGKAVETSILSQQRSILINCSDEDYAAILELAKMLEEQAAKNRRISQLFTLKNANPTSVADSLNRLYASLRTGPAAQQRPEDQVSVTALPQTSAIVVAATKEKMEEVAGLIAALDKEEVAPQLEFRIFPLANASPVKVLPLLKQMLADIQKGRPGETITVQADEATKSIIVTARGTMFDQIKKLIDTLDKPAAFAKAEVLIIPLKKADATALAVVLTNMLKPSAAAAITPEARALQEQVRLLRVRALNKDEIPELDLTQPIKIDSDGAKPQGSNSLVITSTPDNLKALRAVVEMLDVVPVVDGVVVRVRHLTNADAEAVARILTDMFTQGQKLAGKTGTSAVGRAEPETVAGKGLTNTLAASFDVRTNSVILSGQEETVALAEAVIKDLDRVDGKLVTEVRAFKLRNADAARLAPMLQAVFAEGGTTTAAAGGAAAGGAGNSVIEGMRTHATRLQTALDPGQPRTSSQPKLRPALSIQADPNTNILLVAARSDLMPLIADMIGTMDIPGAGSMNSVRIFPLVNADATRLQTVVNGLYTGPQAKFVRDEDKPNVAVDTRTNSLIVSASDKTFAMLETLLAKLDEKSTIDTRDTKVIPLKNADATAMAATMQKMADARVQRLTSLGAKDSEALKMLIQADARSNSLVITGSPEGFELVKGLAEMLDSASPGLDGQIQIFPLKEGNAANVATTLTTLFTQRYAAARTPDIARQKPIVLADVRTNALLVAANADDSKVVESLLKRLDVKLDNATVQLVVLPMKNNDAAVVGNTIRTMFASRLTSLTPPGQTPAPQDRVDVASDTLTNSLIVSASKENIELIKGLLDKIDKEIPPESGLIQIYQLKKAEPSRVASLLQSLVQQGLYKPSVVAATGSTATAQLQARERVAIVSDERTGALIVSASKENLAILEAIIKQVDTDVDLLSGDIRIYGLKKADATRMATMLQQFFTSKRTAELAVNTGVKIMPVTIVGDARTNTLIVTGGKDIFASVEAMLTKLDADEIVPLTDFRVFPLKRATATVIQPTLQQLMTNRISRPGVTRDPVTVLADPRANALIVGAAPEDMAAAEALIARMDSEPDAGMAVQIFPLVKGDATTVSKTIQSLFVGANGRPSLTVSVDERTNALIVSAGEADMARVRELVSQLDKETVASISEIKVFTLKNADANELSTLLLAILTNKPKAMTTVSANRQTLIQFVTQTKEGQDLIATALQEGVLITPDRRSNSLVVCAPAENMTLLASLIEAMDSVEPRAAEIRVFKLMNADCRTMSTLLGQLMRGSGTTGAGGAGGATASAAAGRSIIYTMTGPGQRLAEGGDPGATAANLGTSQQDALTITMDIRTNSLLVGGTRQYVDMAERIIKELDSSPAQERVSEVIRLRNARAADVQTALRTFMDQEIQRIRTNMGNDGLGSAERMLEREIAIVSVANEGNQANSNTLLLSASPRYFKTVQDMINQMDKPAPQVLIQVLLAEVTLDDSKELGIDWQYLDVGSNRTYKAGTDFGVSARTNGFSFSVTGGDLSFFLRALEGQGRLEVLSRPQLTTADNQSGTINIGQQVPFIRDTRITEAGTTLSTVQYEDVGIKLTVLPRINPDGFVRLNVAPEVSSVSSSSIDISPGVKAPIINSRKAQTTVTVQDGHTIIIGGLITTRDDIRESKVPILGDIPLLGLLFKSTTVVKERTELLIVLTPHVLRNGSSDEVACEQIRDLNALRKATPETIHNDLLRPFDGVFRGPASRPASPDALIQQLSPEVPPVPGAAPTNPSLAPESVVPGAMPTNPSYKLENAIPGALPMEAPRPGDYFGGPQRSRSILVTPATQPAPPLTGGQ
jgi:type II secretion system protein D